MEKTFALLAIVQAERRPRRPLGIVIARGGIRQKGGRLRGPPPPGVARAYRVGAAVVAHHRTLLPQRGFVHCKERGEHVLRGEGGDGVHGDGAKAVLADGTDARLRGHTPPVAMRIRQEVCPVGRRLSDKIKPAEGGGKR